MIGCKSPERVIQESGGEREWTMVFRGYDMCWPRIERAKRTKGWLGGE